MSKRIVAFAALVSKNSSEQNAFLTRAKKVTSEVFQFSRGWDIVNWLATDAGKKIDDIRIHDHGFFGGIIGDGNNLGWYTDEYRTSHGDGDLLYYQASTANFAYRVSVNQIKLSKNYSIVTYGCNCSPFAMELSRYLGEYKRADISVTGADNNVYEKSGMAHVDRRTDGVSGGARGQFRTYKNGVQISSAATWSYK
jgi:hypothetical protein